MATSSSSVSEEQLLCSICLDVYREPVTTPCGHSFCKACVEAYWTGLNVPTCPLCKTRFSNQPQLQINFVLRDVVEHFKRPVNVRKDVGAASGDGVACDVCLGDRMTAVKSCLVCLTSYCEEHLKSHSARFTKHKLMEPVANLEDRMCQKHERLLELYCKKDQAYICVMCTDHQTFGHEVVNVRKEHAVQKAKLERTADALKEQLQVAVEAADRHSASVRQRKDQANRDIQRAELLCLDLIGSVERIRQSFLSEAQSKMEEVDGEGLEVWRRLDALATRRLEVEKLLSSSDPLDFIKKLPSVSSNIPVWDGLFCEDTPDLMAKPLNTFMKAIQQLPNACCSFNKFASLQLHTVSVTLDRSTAHPSVILFGEARNKIKVDCNKRNQRFRPEPQRFTTLPGILGAHPLTATSYWEVEVHHDAAGGQGGQRTSWFLGVATEAEADHCRARDFSWTLECRNGWLTAGGTGVEAEPMYGRWWIGVCYDAREKTVAFYDALRSRHLHTFGRVRGAGRRFPVFCPDTGTRRSVGVTMTIRKNPEVSSLR